MSFNFWGSKYRSWSHEYVQPGIEFILVWAIVAYMQIDRNLIDRRDSLIDGPLVVWTRDPSSRDSSSYFVLSFISLGVLESFSEGSSTGGSDEACSDLQQGWKNTNIRYASENTQKTWMNLKIGTCKSKNTWMRVFVHPGFTTAKQFSSNTLERNQNDSNCMTHTV